MKTIDCQSFEKLINKLGECDDRELVDLFSHGWVCGRDRARLVEMGVWLPNCLEPKQGYLVLQAADSDLTDDLREHLKLCRVCAEDRAEADANCPDLPAFIRERI